MPHLPGHRRRTGPAPRSAGLVFVTLLLGLAGVALAGVLLLGGAAAWYTPQLPSLDKVVNYQPRQPLQVFTQDGVGIAQFGAERRQFVPIAEIPRTMQDALLAVEDARFRSHGGIDLRGLARAVVANLTGGMRQGASTITQQVARTFFLSTRRTPERKIKEALLALKIESQLGKDEILELYMNQIYLGQRAYGFGAAAQVYFGKPLAALSVAEMAMLAGLPQNPAYANPVTNFERARQRQLVVLSRMRETGVIDEVQWAAARAERLHLRSPLDVDLHAEHVAELARQAVVQRFGEQAYSRGYKVYTAIRAADQQAAHAAVRRAVLEFDRRQPYRGPEDQEALPDGADAERLAALALKDHRDDEDLRVAVVLRASAQEVVALLASGETVRLTGEGLRAGRAALAPRAGAELAIRRGSVIRVVRTDRATPKGTPRWALAQWPQVQAAFVALDPADGRVRALVGGFDFGRSQFNHVTQAWRQPGSSFKPFLYSAALERGIMPATLVNDAPLVSADGNAPSGWNPQNSDGQFDGPVTLRQGLARSKNLVSIRVVQHMGLAFARDWTQRFGFDRDKQPDNLTLALGAGSTTPLQLASAYAVLANGGHRVAPVVIERITDAQGQVLYQAPPAAPPGEDSRVISARNAFVTGTLLQEVTRSGTAARAQQALKRPDIYGKTGTTNDAVDAWFGGFQSGLAAVAWMGYDDPRSLGQRESGGGLALPIWIDYMAQALRGVPVQQPAPPEGVVSVEGDWRYAEYAEGGQVERIGVEDEGWLPGWLRWLGGGSAASSPRPASPAPAPEPR